MKMKNTIYRQVSAKFKLYEILTQCIETLI